MKGGGGGQFVELSLSMTGTLRLLGVLVISFLSVHFEISGFYFLLLSKTSYRRCWC